MIDFHTHILPRMDDGSRRMAETQKMLKMEYDQGVRQVVASSHFYAQHEFPETFLDRRERRLARVREILHEEEWGRMAVVRKMQTVMSISEIWQIS